MSVTLVAGLPASVAGAPLAQVLGSEIDRAQHAEQRQAARAAAERLADRAAGIGEMTEDQGISERGSGNRPSWTPYHAQSGESGNAASPAPDASADRGTYLDVLA